MNTQPTSSAGTGGLTLHFVRHGESLANEADKARRPRPSDWDALSERGWEQARGLGRRLQGHGIEVIVASTMRRAQETARGDQRRARPGDRDRP